MARRIDAYRIVRGDNLGDPETLNRRFEDIDLRVAQTEDQLLNVDAVADRVESLALSRLNDVLVPLTAEAIDRLTAVSTLFEAQSSSEITVGAGQKQFIVVEGSRLTFAPLPYLLAFPTGNLSIYMTARVVQYTQATGLLLIEVLQFVGEGTFSDWQIAPLAFASSLDSVASQAIQARNEAVAAAADADADRATVATDKATVATDRGAAQTAAAAASTSLASFNLIYRGALASAPAIPAPAVGHWYFDTTLQQSMVYTALGWAPLFSISLGGIRQGDVVATAGQTAFNVGGGFTFLNVWKNGIKLVSGTDFTAASPDFTLTAGATAGDVVSYLAYYATESTDFYSKTEADERYIQNALLTARGDIIRRGASGPERLAKGTANSLLVMDATDPGWRTLTGLLDAVLGIDRGTLLYRGAAAWIGLPAGVAGRFLVTGGPSGDPSWLQVNTPNYPAAAAADFWGNIADKFLVTDDVWAAAVYRSLVEDTFITPNLGTGLNFKVTLIGNRTLANPIGTKEGQAGEIIIRQDAVGGRTLAYGSNWKFSGSAPALSTAANARDILGFKVLDDGTVLASLLKGV